MPISFSKYHGSGNDFIIIDDRALSFPCQDKALIIKLCHRRFGVGADGLVLLQPSTVCDYRMRIFNCDGTEAAMCGNGLRCLIHYINSLGLSRDVLFVQTMHQRLRCSVDQDVITTQIHKPFMVSQLLYIDVEAKRFACCIVDTAVPHAVVFVEDLHLVDVEKIGRTIRFDKQLAPSGVNVNFVQMLSANSLKIRTYERGVEAETMSCGTGAAAAAYVALQKGGVTLPVQVLPLSMDPLWIHAEYEGGQIVHMHISGKAVRVFDGIFI